MTHSDRYYHELQFFFYFLFMCEWVLCVSRTQRIGPPRNHRRKRVLKFNEHLINVKQSIYFGQVWQKFGVGTAPLII